MDISSQQPKRSRVLLSCAPCRNSKLKCDRQEPCGQCTKKQRPDACLYAPKPVKKKAVPKGMSARLKRLEGMVRDMMDAEGGEEQLNQILKGGSNAKSAPALEGQVVQSSKGTTYIGATHCMALLEDIEDMKSYFDDDDAIADDVSPTDEMDGPDFLLYSRNGPIDKNELYANIPEKTICDRLVMRYFTSSSPSQLVIHKPTFNKKYVLFWQDPESVSLNWIAQLFMVLALGTIFNHFSAPQELEADSSLPTMNRIRTYRSCAGQSLVWAKYTQPSLETLPAFVLYVEAFFIFNRAAQMNCYILAGVSLRLMIKMGLHRDPSKLANISVFEGEMRRRLWAMATQIELLVSFHMGLPSMMQGLEYDTAGPLNLQDEDFGEDTTELPAERSRDVFTTMTYPIHKNKLMRVFGQIVRQAHALSPPTYTEVMRLDTLLNETWNNVPDMIKIKPMDQSVGDSPTLIIQRFGIEALYHKSRCVLHRRYLAEPVPNHEHDYSRRQCLEGAITLLNAQTAIWSATRQGNILSQCGWFLTSLAVHDYMLAAMILYLLIQDEHYDEPGSETAWVTQDKQLPSKEKLIDMLKTSHNIWTMVSSTVGELRKTADTLSVMLSKLGHPVGTPASTISAANTNVSGYDASNRSWSSGPKSGGEIFSGSESGNTSGSAFDGTDVNSGASTLSLSRDTAVPNFPSAGDQNEAIFGTVEFDSSWVDMGSEMDWRQMEIMLPTGEAPNQNWEPGMPGWTTLG